MFTGIIQGRSTITNIVECDDLRTVTLELPPGLSDDLNIGASVAVDGVCLTVTALLPPNSAVFDIVLQSLSVTTLNSYSVGAVVNTERAAKDGAEIGGHPLSGHIDFSAKILSVAISLNNRVFRLHIPSQFIKYVFPKGYIAINGASLTVSEVNRAEGWFEVWLIPETRRMTVFEQKQVGDYLNIEIERGTQVMVDTVRAAVEETLGKFTPLLEAMLDQHGLSIDDLISSHQLEPVTIQSSLPPKK